MVLGRSLYVYVSYTRILLYIRTRDAHDMYIEQNLTAVFPSRTWKLALSDNRNVYRKTVTNYSKPVEKPGEQSISVVRNWHKSYVLANVI